MHSDRDLRNSEVHKSEQQKKQRARQGEAERGSRVVSAIHCQVTEVYYCASQVILFTFCILPSSRLTIVAQQEVPARYGNFNAAP